MDSKRSGGSGRRMGGRTQFQEEQKRVTRSKLIIAARRIFSEKGYASATVDDIVKCAEVSRGAFYAHFEDKFAVFEVLFEELRPPALAVFEELALLDAPDLNQIEQWLNHLITSAKEVSDVLFTATQVAAIEATFDEDQFAFGIELINVLAKGMPAFKLAQANTAAGKEAMVRALMLLLQISAITRSVIVGQKWIEPAIAIKVLAQQIHQFIHSGASNLKTPQKKRSAK